MAQKKTKARKGIRRKAALKAKHGRARRRVRKLDTRKQR